MKKSKFFISFGRLALTLSFLSLLGAWYASVSGDTLFGRTETHAFNDAIVLALLGIGFLLDGMIHNKEEVKK